MVAYNPRRPDTSTLRPSRFAYSTAGTSGVHRSPFMALRAFPWSCNVLPCPRQYLYAETYPRHPGRHTLDSGHPVGTTRRAAGPADSISAPASAPGAAPVPPPAGATTLQLRTGEPQRHARGEGAAQDPLR